MSNAIYRMTRGSFVNGLMWFRLAIWKDGKEVWHLPVNSGAAGAQVLRTYEDKKSLPGNYEPIPEGEYKIDPEIHWAGGKDNWDEYWSPGLGPFLIDIVAPREGQKGYRGVFRIHEDSNRSYGAGSAGCPVSMTRVDSKDLVEAHRKYRPEKMIVDYGLGTVPGAPAAPSASPVDEITKERSGYCTVTLDGLAVGEAMLKDGTSFPTTPTIAKLMGLAVAWQGSRNNIALTSKE